MIAVVSPSDGFEVNANCGLVLSASLLFAQGRMWTPMDWSSLQRFKTILTRGR